MKYKIDKVTRTSHASDRLNERGISWDEVQEVVMAPDMTWEDQRNGSIVCEGRGNTGGRLAVCLVNPPKNGRAIVKTAYRREDGDGQP